jgi:hypothetical protein
MRCVDGGEYRQKVMMEARQQHRIEGREMTEKPDVSGVGVNSLSYLE